MKLWRLALDKSALKGEVDNAAIAIIHSLRNRNYNLEQLTMEPIETASVDWGTAVFNFGKHRGEMIKDVPADYLLWAYHWIESDSELEKRYGNLHFAIGKYLKM